MRKQLLRLTPFAEVGSRHPIFQFETRSLRHARDLRAFVRFSLRWLGQGALIAASLIGGIVFLAGMSGTPLDPLSLAGLCTFALAASGVFGAALDYTSATAGLGGISRELVSGRWTLLRVTPLREGGIILAKHAVAQMRGWRPVMLIIGLRAGLIVCWAVTLIGSGEASPVSALALIVIVVSAAAEPIARLRGFAALGLYVSARVANGIGGQLMLLGYLGLFWFIQLVFLVALVIFIGPMAVVMTLGLDRTFTVIWMIFVPMAAAAFSGLALTVRAWALRATVRCLMRYDDRR